MIGLSSGPRFRPAALFRPRALTVLGAEGRQGARVMRTLAAAGFHGPIAPARVAGAALVYDPPGAPAQPPDLAILCEGGGEPEAVMPALAASGVFACVVLAAGATPGTLRRCAERTGVRSLGPDSFGLAVPAIGLDATLAHLPVGAGRLALVSQSAALCRTVLDWAAPSGVGFSHVVGVGMNDDVGYGLVLDWLSRDAGTGAILLDLRRLKDARRFLSAARAAARLRPVVAIRPGGWAADEGDARQATLAAALHRVGVLCVDRLEDFLGAAETLTRVKPVRGERLAIVSNAMGPAHMAADAALRERVELAGAPVPVELARLAEAAAAVTVVSAGAVLVVHAPEGEDDAAALAEVATAARTHALPWIVCALGEATGAAHRRSLAAGGVAVFAGPGDAVRAFVHLLQDRRSRAAAGQRPAADILAVRPDPARVADAFARGDLAAALREYGIVAVTGPPGMLRLSVATDPLFGPFFALGAALAGDLRDRVVDLPPLNLPLAHAMVERSALVRGLAGAWGHAVPEGLADLLVRISALLVDMPAIEALHFDPCAPEGGMVRFHAAGVEPPRFALPPYPSALVGAFDTGTERLVIRPIRPEDADAHAAFFGRLPAEDIRRRFFTALRELSAEQIVRMTEIDYEREMAFVAQRGAGEGETVGVARLVREALTDEAEFAIVVQPDMKGRGLARHLMQRLFDWGRAQGVQTVVGEILAENHPMRVFAERLGFTVRAVPYDPELVEARLDLRGGG